MTAVYEDDRISVFGSMQCPFYIKDAMVKLFGWGPERVRIVQNVTGGGFGGKEEYPSMLAGHAALAAYKTGRPVNLIFDRTEDIESTTKRHPSVVRIQTAIDKNGLIMGMRAQIRLNAGAYMGLSQIVLQRSLFNCTGVYNIPALQAQAACIATNTVPNGAFRGFGAPQVLFAMEMHMQKIAHLLNMDPLVVKERNFAKKGDRTATNGTFRQAIKLPEIVEEACRMSGYREKSSRFGPGSLKGMGTGFFLHGCGFTGNGEHGFSAKLKKRQDGKAEILVASTDMGQGIKTTLSKIVAHTLKLPLSDVICENPNTDRVTNSGPTVASRTIIIVGRLLERASRELGERWNEPGEPEVVVNYKAPEGINWDNDTFTGEAYPGYSWGINVAEVEVDPVTFEVNVKGVWAVYDIGHAIDEQIVRGQIEGGIMQGLGYGVMENMESKDGRIQQRTVTDYAIPTSVDFPLIKTALIDNPFENGPYGAKGVGELTLLGAAPAVVSAVANALGVEIDRLPVTPEYLMEVAKRGTDR
jgi:CO/xanthine dehydrogenase Mo-binding subunit